ncbi:MAG: hypothetical protein A4E20_17030 [Nitrospira sp. SG-bin2]|jgi:hypothetical protein|uniref:surface-adhesin E family protein n=1 Tax=Nitrospira cf. moscoviensis SBR1015 TaxID=96242 RepID=UPI000A0DB44C|nr:surface-adhesin E family protein [Nitrospira cf. moscoviensis SBR1015]OQW30179.1 MAG: hypothetical protein A4E20_17030 [Nitrospira sp. SG-bin2]
MSFSIRFCRRWPVACGSLFIALLVLSTSPASAEWVEVGTTDEATVYADPATIQRKGDTVKMWHLHNFKTAQTVLKKSYLSSRSQDEYDCTEDRHRARASTSFSGSMGSGKVRSSYSIKGKWEPVPLGTVTHSLWKVACEKQ